MSNITPKMSIADDLDRVVVDELILESDAKIILNFLSDEGFNKYNDFEFKLVSHVEQLKVVDMMGNETGDIRTAFGQRLIHNDRSYTLTEFFRSASEGGELYNNRIKGVK